METETRMRPLVTRGPQTLSVAPWTRKIGGMPPHVALNVGEVLDSQLMLLTPSEARRTAIALLEAAEQVDAER
jgi:hypothetical protein